MCVISFYRPRVMPDIKCLENGAARNDDGHGWAVIAGDEILVGKSMDADAAIEAFEGVRKAHPDSYALFHSRIATDGETSLDNCHPFAVGGDGRTVIAHNGILPKEARPGKGDPRSDTRIFAEDMIPRGDFGHLGQRLARRRLRRWLDQMDYPNKVVMLTTDPAYGRRAYVINDHLGEWHNGVWWSNSSYESWRPVSYYSSTSSRYYSYTEAERHINQWDQLYADGVINGTEYGDAVCDIYTNAGTWIKYGTSYGPPWHLLMYGSREPVTLGPVGTETLGRQAATGWTESANTYADCPLCKASATVNVHVGYCTACLRCTDCETRTADCMCYIPGTSQRYAEAVTETDDAQEGANAAQVARRPLALPAGESS